VVAFSASTAVAATSIGVEAASTNITGALGKAAQGYKVLMVTARGSASVATVGSDGKFSIQHLKVGGKWSHITNGRHRKPICGSHRVGEREGR